ncbi:7-carboxy-7-deazaguanine synthase [Pseudobythopirellula maris]|uniref:7-carboxy-7-deazaguanine synthase n=1 Tax=Pseudobythopirellula maris TaxID=2527991 RepID=A0A5C5ZJE8_9BACT|nr:7-carboxy-7-deazaguanine synthase [Pseudobythopirellula maris]
MFVRASGCNLRCWFCDTPHASWAPEGKDLSVDEIAAEVEEWDCRDVVVTGGEPMLFAELIPLVDRLRAAGRVVTIETAGTLHLDVACDLMSISPKLAGSTPPVEEHPHWARRHERSRLRVDVLRRLIREHAGAYQLKFVVDEAEELGEVEELLALIAAAGGPAIDPERVLLMPQGVEPGELERRAEWLRPACAERGYKYCPRMQIEWFGAARGT